MKNRLGTIVPYIIGGGLLLGGALIQLRKESAARYEEGVRKESEGDVVGAIKSYEYALENYTPLPGPHEEALDRLEAIASQAEIDGDSAVAILAWQSLLSGLSVTENITQPHADVLNKAELRLNDLRSIPVKGMPVVEDATP